MLVIDENKLRLAKMQETLLKVSTTNRQENLDKYIKTITEIDADAFKELMDKIAHIDEHNHSLEEDLSYLKEIYSLYEQLIELQNSFKNNCLTYGNRNIQLSDLSDIDIEYLENRIKAIDGYLSNLKEIEESKKEIQLLNEQLVQEEKKKIVLDNKLDELEQSLRNSFGLIEGRAIIDGKLEYTNVKQEYEKINYDFDRLVDDYEYLRSSLAYIRNEKREVSEKVKVAEVCYSSMPNADSKQILDEINAEYLKVKYKLTMLEILELLVKKIDGYSSFVEKRTAMLDLIKYRLVCMESLGIKNSVDPFSRIKVKEQLDVVRSLTDNSKIVSDMMHKISEMNSNVEAMIFQNNGYLITINDTRKIIVDKRSFNDIDIAPLVAFDELLVKQSVLDNQVIDVKQAGYMFNMGIISQKTASVIKRVNQMINESSVQKDSVQVKKVEETVPELVIVPVKVKEEPIVLEPVLEVPVMEEIKVEPVDKVEVEEVKELPLVAPVVEPVLDIVKSEPVETQPVVDIFSQQNDLFETITPFAEPTFFVDRADTDVDKTKSVVQQPFQLDNIELIPSVLEKEDVPVIDSMDESMPEVFWVTQEDDGIKTEETNNVLSFDEQINALLSTNDNENAKVRKKVA